MNQIPENQEDYIAKKLDAIKGIPERDPRAAEAGRNTFLAKAQALSNEQPASKNQPKKWWMFLPYNREQNRLQLLPTIMLVIVLLFSGTGVTVAAAQSALPNQLLYPVKLSTETLALNLTNDPLEKIDLSVSFALRRSHEIETVYTSNGTISDKVIQNMLDDIDEAIEKTSELTDNDRMLAELVRIRTELQSLIQAMNALEPNDSQAQHIMRIMALIQERIDAIVNGSEDVDNFRINIQEGEFELEMEHLNDQSDDHSGSSDIENLTTSAPTMDDSGEDTGKTESTLQPDPEDGTHSATAGSDDPASSTRTPEPTHSESGSGSSGSGSGSGSNKTPKPDSSDD